MQPTKVTIELAGIKITSEISNDMPSPDEIMDLFKAVFLGATFTYDQWITAMKTKIEFE